MFDLNGHEGSQIIRLPVLIILALNCVPALAIEDRNIWVLVDTGSLVLMVMRNDKPVDVYKNISIGRNGAADNKLLGDDRTPLGSYRIGWINQKSRYRRFFGLNYPSLADAKRALRAKAIDLKIFKRLLRADIYEEIPPQNTVLGGQIGIHGLGGADPHIHQTVNWTHGCIALTNKQIDRLSRWLKEGVIVQIQ